MRKFIRYTEGKALAGSSIARKIEPKDGDYRQLSEISCCGQLSGEWAFLDEYAAPIIPGLLDFPDHFHGISSLDPNLVGLIGDTAVMLYINVTDLSLIFHQILADMVGNSGTLTLTQGVNSVTYGFLPGAFIYDDSVTMVFYDTVFGDSIPGTINVLIPSAGDFNSLDPITISVSLS